MQFLKILIVEDETITAMDMKEALEAVGHTVTAIARTYQQAIASVKNNLPDLAIVDIALDNSEADGIITAEKIRTLHSMPIIYLTANSEKEAFQRAKETLPVAYLLKPFGLQELLMQVEVVGNYFKSVQPVYTSDALLIPVKNKGQHRIIPSEVCYIEADGSSVKMYVVDEKAPHLISMGLSSIEKYFNTPNFFALSRSWLVNLDYLDYIVGDNLFLKNHKKPIKFPSNKKKELMQKLRTIKTK